MLVRCLLACLVALPAAASAADSASPYAGEEARAVKALSEAEVKALRNGEGMGLAKAAELNGYPGPAHALELAAPLGLDSGQVLRLAAIRDRMGEAARALGQDILQHEARLDALFAGHEITPDALASETAAIGALQGRLRAAHLAAHLATRDVLAEEQVERYRQLRGYAAPGHGPHRH